MKVVFRKFRFCVKRFRPQVFMNSIVPKRLLTLSLLIAFSPLMLASSASSAITPDPNTIRMTADKQSYNLEKKKYLLNGRVTVAYQDMQIVGPQAEVEMNAAGKPQVAHFTNRPSFKRVKPQEGEDTVIGDIINIYLGDDRYAAQGSVQSHITTVAADPFFIRSDIQEFDNKNKVVSASGNVKVDYKGSQAYSTLANVRMKDNGKADRVIFSGGARIDKENSEINGDKITVMVDSGNLIAERNVKTRVDLQNKTKPNDPTKVLITSDYQQYDKASDTMLASGNVRIVYGDYVAVGPKATFKLKDKDLDRIFLTGRPTITENGRTITADKITITTNPKNFDALGNVKVNFKASDKSAQTGAHLPDGKAAPVTGKGKPTAGKSNASDDPSEY